MPFKEYTGLDRVELKNASQVEVGDDGIEDVVKAVMTSLASIQVMESRNTVIIVDIFSD